MREKEKNDLIKKIIFEQYNIVFNSKSFFSLKELQNIKEENEFNGGVLPEILTQKLNKISIGYVNSFIRFNTVEKLFLELLEFISDPMEIVNIIYNSIIFAAKKYHITNKEKIKNTYPLLVSLARQKIEERGL